MNIYNLNIFLQQISEPYYTVVRSDLLTANYGSGRIFVGSLNDKPENEKCLAQLAEIGGVRPTQLFLGPIINIVNNGTRYFLNYGFGK
jgi:hypothetical protein